MKEKYLAAKNVLEKYNQEHLLAFYEELSDEEKERTLNDILTVNFGQIKELYEMTKKAVEFENSVIEPISYIEKDKLSQEDYKKYEEIGIKAIKDGKLAVVTMAGGQGTRLGHNGPKGTYYLEVGEKKSIFEILCQKLKDAKELYGVTIPWYIMVSEENQKDTKDFFEANNYFGYSKEEVSFFAQGKLPVVGEDGKILMNEDKRIKQAADGHGGIFEAMIKNAVAYDMQTRGIEWIFIGGVDNILVKSVDPVLMGLTIANNKTAAGKSVVKAGPEEKVGVFCKRDGKPSVIEYSEITKEMAEAREEDGQLKFGESHILCNLFNINTIDRITKEKLPYHVAHKKSPYLNEKGEMVKPEKPNSYKFEAFIFDAFGSLDDMLIMRVKREEEFAPVKNAEGVDSPETATKLYKDFYGIK